MKTKTAIINIRNLKAGTVAAHNVRIPAFDNVAEAIEKLGESKVLELVNYAHSLQIRSKKFQEIRSKA